VKDVKRVGLIETDSVHLTSRACRNAAVILCNRIRAMELDEEQTEEKCNERKKIRV
jgi:hypothetical protein